MENKLRLALRNEVDNPAIPAGTVIVHCPVPGERRFKHVRIKSTGEEIRLNQSRSLQDHFGVISATFLDDLEMIDVESDESMIARTSYKVLATWQPIDAAVVRAADLPNDSTPFRSCWRISGGKVEVDPVKARVIVLDIARKQRNAKLAESDGDKARLDEIGTKEQQKAVKEYRQKLRDMPAVIAAEIESMSVEQLETYAVKFPTIGE